MENKKPINEGQFRIVNVFKNGTKQAKELVNDEEKAKSLMTCSNKEVNIGYIMRKKCDYSVMVQYKKVVNLLGTRLWFNEVRFFICSLFIVFTLSLSAQEEKKSSSTLDDLLSYVKYCQSDSTLVVGSISGRNLTGKYDHRKPTFEDFIQWYSSNYFHKREEITILKTK